MTSRTWAALGATLAALITLSGGGGRLPTPAPTCGWPCRDAWECLRPCYSAIRGDAIAGRIADETIELCARQLAGDDDPRIGESVFMALSYYPPADDELPVGPMVDQLAASGQVGVAAGISSAIAFDRGDDVGAFEQFRQIPISDAPACPTARLAISLMQPLCDGGQLGKCAETIDRGLAALDGVDADALRYQLVVGHIRVLAFTGGIDEALRESEEMFARAVKPLERAWLSLIRIDLLYARKNLRQAELETWKAINWAWVAVVDQPRPGLVGVVLQRLVPRGDEAVQVLSSGYYLLASLLLEERRFDEADRALDVTQKLTPDDPTADQLYIRALVARGRNQLVAAEAGLSAALIGGVESGDGQPPTGELVWAVPFELGRVRALMGDTVGAEVAFRQAIDEVETLRASAPGSEAQMIAKYRQPYEELLGLLAHAGRWRDALAVLARLDAGRLNSDVAAPAGFSRRERAIQDLQPSARSLSPWPGTARAPADADQLLAAWRGRHLVAVFRAGDELCRLEAVDGALRGACMGSAEALERAADALSEDPNDAAAARRVGDALIPPGNDVLDLLLVGPIARAPTAALRDGHGLIVARRPLQRVLGLLDDGRTAGAELPARVIGYAGHTRIAAAAEREAGEVARQLGVEAAIGPAATLQAVLGGAPTVLHVAGHAHMIDGVPALELADGDLSAETIAAQDHGPRLVVLASCDSAAARDEGGWGSLAAAFLHAGSERVIASDRAVDDVEAQALMRAFYDAGGVGNPARALGVSQAARSAALPADAGLPAATTWAAFTVIAAPPRALPPPR